VPRRTAEDLRVCAQEKKCLDCYLEGEDTRAVQWQQRRKVNVPCCRKHFYAHKKKTNEADAKKYARNSDQKRQKRQCVYKGCRNKLIPQELLPPWIKEKTCGLHTTFKAFRMNRASFLRLITEHCLKPEERDGWTVQCVVYRRGDALMWIGASNGRVYRTISFTVRSLVKLHKQLH
jgi:hypothetical protein